MMWQSHAAALLLIAGGVTTPQPADAAEHPPICRLATCR